ncbi:MAG: DUF2306 domain-containing protein [Candidatus Eisenbacteria bacterium]|nr:DUF2306 domain-containing protein [Candidatus Eisenbacteria bacterium]
MSVVTLAANRRSEWVVPALLVLLSLVPAIAGTVRLVDLGLGAEVTERNARFFASPLPVALHILAVVPYSILGAFQFSPGLRRRHRALHRAAGKVLLAAGFISALTGLWMAQFYPWPEGDGVAVYLERIVFGGAMFLFLVLGAVAIPRRDFAGHGAWMIRAYAIGLGAGTQALTHLPYFVFVGRPDETARGFLMGAGWVINVIVAEWILRRRPMLVL